jgi:hypothetical protein
VALNESSIKQPGDTHGTACGKYPGKTSFCFSLLWVLPNERYCETAVPVQIGQIFDSECSMELIRQHPNNRAPMRRRLADVLVNRAIFEIDNPPHLVVQFTALSWQLFNFLFYQRWSRFFTEVEVLVWFFYGMFVLYAIGISLYVTLDEGDDHL